MTTSYPMADVTALLGKVMDTAGTASAAITIINDDGLEISVSLSRTIYRTCRFCGQQIYNDGKKGQDDAWVTKDDEDDECSRNNYEQHEPKEFSSDSSNN